MALILLCMHREVKIFLSAYFPHFEKKLGLRDCLALYLGVSPIVAR
jgi:hypothetical protein